MFSSIEDIQQKLTGTIILYSNLPVYVTQAKLGANGELGVDIAYIPYRRPRVIGENIPQFWSNIEDVSLDYRSISTKLGYLNYNLKDWSYPVFVSRFAARKPTQGLGQNNLHFSISPAIGGKKKGQVFKPEISFSSLVEQQSFRDMVLDQYPSRRQVADILKTDGVLGCAFSKYFAIRKDSIGPMYLLYKGKEIAWSEDIEQWKLARSYAYLEESFEHYDIKYKLTG